MSRDATPMLKAGIVPSPGYERYEDKSGMVTLACSKGLCLECINSLKSGTPL